jgi:hypothetical protein
MSRRSAASAELQAETVAVRAKSYTQSIVGNIEYLRRQIVASGNSIIKRWQCLTLKQRKELLSRVEPNICPTDYAVADLTSRSIGQRICDPRKSRAQGECRFAYLLPYRNLDRLSVEWGSLISLLHNRAMSRRDDWAIFDNEQIQLARSQRWIDEEPASGCIIMRGDRYGEWKLFDQEEVHCGYAYGSPRALLILETQDQLLRFLRNFINVILGTTSVKENMSAGLNVDAGTVGAEIAAQSCPKKWKKFVRAGTQPSKYVSWASPQSLYASQPFQSFPKFDIDIIIEIAENQSDEAYDEVWLRQTDPEYFYERAKFLEAKWNGSLSKVGENLRLLTPESHRNIAYMTLIKACQRARDWRVVRRKCDDLKAVLGNHGNAMNVAKPLPTDKNGHFDALRSLLWDRKKYYRQELTKAVGQSEAFNSLFELAHTVPPNAATFRLKDCDDLYHRDRTAWCLLQLSQETADADDLESGFLCFELYLHCLEDHLRNNPQESRRIDQDIFMSISDIAALQRICRNTGCCRPVPREPTPAEREKHDEYFKKRFVRSYGSLPLVGSKPQAPFSDLGNVVYPLDQFQIPGGPRDQTWLSKRDGAHLALGKAWKVARVDYRDSLEMQGAPQALIDEQLQLMGLSDSKAHNQRLDAEKQQILQRLNSVEKRAQLVPHEELYSLPQSDPCPQERTIQEPRKGKTKTRSHRVPSTAKAVEESPPVLYWLKQNSPAYRMTTLLFPDSTDSPSKEVADWHDFVAAMTKFGFQVECGGGSAFRFKGEIKLPQTPSTTVGSSISFHRPHPSTELSPVAIRALGKRLNRRYGWQSENFQIGGA